MARASKRVSSDDLSSSETWNALLESDAVMCVLPYTLKIDVPQRTKGAECPAEILCASIKFTVRRPLSSITFCAKTFTFIYARSCEDGRSLAAILSSHDIVIHFIFTRLIIFHFSSSSSIVRGTRHHQHAQPLTCLNTSGSLDLI